MPVVASGGVDVYRTKAEIQAILRMINDIERKSPYGHRDTKGIRLWSDGEVKSCNGKIALLKAHCLESKSVVDHTTLRGVCSALPLTEANSAVLYETAPAALRLNAEIWLTEG